VTDPHNLGGILRTAVCAGATGVVVPRHRSALLSATVTKAASGAIEYLPVAVTPGVAQAVGTLSAAGVWTVGLEPDAPTSVFGLSVATEAVALVLGSEGRGLSRLVRSRCDVLARIPQAGTAGAAMGSLNVAAAAAVACFAVAAQRA
jgi:23S rRNA (guanosine2251-2'-O)-methyltransferase